MCSDYPKNMPVLVNERGNLWLPERRKILKIKSEKNKYKVLYLYPVTENDRQIWILFETIQIVFKRFLKQVILSNNLNLT